VYRTKKIRNRKEVKEKTERDRKKLKKREKGKEARFYVDGGF